MTERKGTPIQEMPDFAAAVKDYGRILNGHCLVHPEDVSRIQAKIEETNRTRTDGNRFINHVNSLRREINLP